MDEKVRRVLTELRQRLQELYGERLEQILLFGSQARGDATEDSDIDVMIVLKGEVSASTEIARTSKICSDLSLDNDVAISRVFTSSQKFKTDNSPLLLNIHREGVLV